MSEIKLQDAILRNSLQILRLAAGEQAAVDQIMADLQAELKQLLNSRDLSASTQRQIKALIVDAEGVIHPAYGQAAKSVDTQALAIIVAEKTVAITEEMMGVTASMPSSETLASLSKDVIIDGAPSSAWWAKQADDLAFKFAAQVQQGIINAETQQQIVQRIVGKRGEPGIMEVSRRDARTLVHSSVMSAANDARLATYRKNSRHIAGVKWLSTLDSHSCKVCAALDGSSWDLEGKPIKGTDYRFQAPPKHWSCRCVLSPIPKSLDELGFKGMDAKIAAASMRASKDGPVKDNGFQAFLERQPDAFVNKTLGKARADMFRAGKITLKDLISASGRELTLEQLQAH